jgi:hypothetical protein
MISPELRIATVVVGAVLVVVSLVGARLFGSAIFTAGGKLARAALGVAGVALLVLAAAPLLGWHSQSRQHIVTTGPRLITPAPPAAGPSSADLVQAASSALTACPVSPPPALPDGATASREQMAAARSAFQAYDVATNAYTQCVDATVERVAKEFAKVSSEKDLTFLKTFGVRAHNAAIDQEQALADQLNAQVRSYNVKHPRS